VPAEIDAGSGYRRYATAQISTAHIIRRFRELDMPLDEIAEVVGTTDLRVRNVLITSHLDRLERALSELRVEGIRTTAPLFRALLADADFRSGNLDIGMLDRKLAADELRPLDPEGDELSDLPFLAAAIAHHEQAYRQSAAGPASAATSRRSLWGAAGRRGALRGGSWT